MSAGGARGRPQVYVTRRIAEAGLRLLEDVCAVRVWPGDEPPPPATLARELAGADGALTLLTDPIDAALMDACPRLRVISNYAVGYDNVAVAAATERGIPVGNTPDALTATTADLAFALLLAAARRVVEGAEYARGGHWKTWGPLLLLGAEVHGATLGLVGLGRIGAEVARRARGFDMRVLYSAPTRRPAEEERALGVEYAPLDDLLARSDFVSLHTPLTPATRHLMNAERLAKMKPGATLVNTARGPIVETEALVAALRAGRLCAALDVTDPEPLPPGHPLYTLPNALITPHIGSATVATRERMAEMAARNLLAGLRGETPPHCVNPQAVGHGRSAAPRPWEAPPQG